MDNLRQQLIERYTAAPAQITHDGVVIDLPVDWESFQALSLDGAARKDALKAYYQNQNHTALRYLSGPNHWLHDEAGFTTGGMADSVELYKSVISLCWLAANDGTVPDKDGCSAESLMDHFVSELALIGRAHNWDRSGTVAGDATRFENYDDGGADRPSCIPGTLPRLYQSVIAHPLFDNIVTPALIDQEIKDFLSEHWNPLITPLKQVQLKQYFDDYFSMFFAGDDINEEAFNAYREFNISKSQQKDLIDTLVQKYGPAFDTRLRYQVKDRLYLDVSSEDPLDQIHIFTLGDFGHFIEQFVLCAPATEAAAASLVDLTSPFKNKLQDAKDGSGDEKATSSPRSGPH